MTKERATELARKHAKLHLDYTIVYEAKTLHGGWAYDFIFNRGLDKLTSEARVFSPVGEELTVPEYREIPEHTKVLIQARAKVQDQREQQRKQSQEQRLDFLLDAVKNLIDQTEDLRDKLKRFEENRWS